MKQIGDHVHVLGVDAAIVYPLPIETQIRGERAERGFSTQVVNDGIGRQRPLLIEQTLKIAKLLQRPVHLGERGVALLDLAHLIVQAGVGLVLPLLLHQGEDGFEIHVGHVDAARPGHAQ